MAKIIVHRLIDDRYAQHKPDILLEGSTIPFDCYIKRYGDYIILIEAGTYISKELLKKIASNESIYILLRDSNKLKAYQAAHESGNEPKEKVFPIGEITKAALSLPETLSHMATNEEKFSAIYTMTADLMRTIFANGSERLPLETFHVCVDQLVKCIDVKTNTIPLLFNIIPHVYTTHHHSTNVAFLAVILATKIGLSEEERIDIGYAGLLHDIGKIRIDQQLLLKPSRLDEDEYETIKQHSEYGYKILAENGITNQKVLDAVRFHHEKLDGSGYPKGLRGKLIPKYAKIIGVCDAFDALTTKRTFRNNYTSYEAMVVMKKEMALQFDEQYIDLFIHMLR